MIGTLALDLILVIGGGICGYCLRRIIGYKEELRRVQKLRKDFGL